MSLIKRLIKYFGFTIIALMFTTLILVVFVDAYEYELTGECIDCLILEDWYKLTDRRGTF